MNRLFKSISFTKNETKVILFIIFVLLAGFSIKYYKQIITGSKSAPFDFTKSDEEFKSKSNFANAKNLYSDKNNKTVDSLSEILSLSEDSLQGRNNLSGQDNGQKSININTAGKDELVELPGVGESIADKIISYRENKKGFKKIEEIMNVNGIGKKKFEKIKNYIKAE